MQRFLWLAVLGALGCSEGAVPVDAGADAGADSGTQPIALGIEADCNPLASSEECLFPYPSRFFQAPDPTTPTGVRNAFHERVLVVPRGREPLDPTPFNQYDGHPPNGPMLVHLGLDVDPSQLVDQRSTERSLEDGAPIAVLDRETGEPVPLLTEMDRNDRDGRSEGRHALILRPMVPFAMGRRYVAVMTSALRDTGGLPIQAPPGFAALRDGQLTDHAALEAARADYEGIFAFLASHGYPRDELVLAWDFAVASESQVIGGTLSMREQALAMAGGTGLAYTITDVRIDPANTNVSRIVEGTFEVPTFINADDEIERNPDGTVRIQPTTQSFPFTMIIPARADAGEPLPLVLFGHGVFGAGREYLTGSIGTGVIQPLAQQAGVVIVATDWIGLSSSDMDRVIGAVVADINNVHVITDRLQQALINNLVLLELTIGTLQNDPMVWDDGDTTRPLLAGGEVHYYGVSLGGIQGSSLISLSRHIRHAVLAVPGGAWSTLLTRSVVYSPVKDLISALYPDPLLQQAFIAMLQMRFDGSDGANIGRLFTIDPLPDAPADRRAVLVEATGDCQVPNIATRILARAMGIEQLTPAHEPVFGLTQAPTPADRSTLAQIAMLDRLADYTPPEENLVPERDNGTHSDSIQLPNAIEQVTAMIRDGRSAQFCTEACDPD